MTTCRFYNADFMNGASQLMLLLSIAIARAGYADEHDALLALTDGEITNATFRGVNSDGKWIFEGDGLRKTYAPDSIVKWGRLASPIERSVVITRDGGMATGTLATYEPRQDNGQVFAIGTKCCGVVNVRYENVRAVLPAPAHSMSNFRYKNQWLIRQASGSEVPADALLMSNADELAGRLASISRNEIRWRAAFGMTTIPAHDVAAIAVSTHPNEAHVNPAASRWLVGLQDGCLAPCEAMTGDMSVLTLDAPSFGGEISVSTTSVKFIQAISGGIVYLSDLEPLSYEHAPFFSAAWKLGIDASVAGGGLRARNADYVKGIGMHSASRVVYRPPSGTRAFHAELALDDTAQGRGSVIGKVLVHGTDETWQETWSSDVIRGDDEPLPVRVSLAGTDAIALIIEYADAGDMLDRAAWLDARLIR